MQAAANKIWIYVVVLFLYRPWNLNWRSWRIQLNPSMMRCSTFVKGISFINVLFAQGFCRYWFSLGHWFVHSNSTQFIVCLLRVTGKKKCRSWIEQLILEWPGWVSFHYSSVYPWRVCSFGIWRPSLKGRSFSSCFFFLLLPFFWEVKFSTAFLIDYLLYCHLSDRVFQL